MDDVDILSVPTQDLLDDYTWEVWKSKFKDYDGAWLGPPCGTFCPARRFQPGPRVIRSVELVLGLKNLSAAEKAEVRCANILCERALDAAEDFYARGKPVGLGNPQPRPDEPCVFGFPRYIEFAARPGVFCYDFDQCTVGAGSVKPTRLMCFFSLALGSFANKRCGHAAVEHWSWSADKGYSCVVAAHPPLRGKHDGGKWKTKGAAAYPAALNAKIAASFAVACEHTRKGGLPSRSPIR